MAPRKIIIDTDPGVDDMVGLLLSLSASSEELEIPLISVTYGNVPLNNTLKNTVALFHVLEKELVWRKSVGRPEGFEAMRKSKPLVAVGPVHPLEEEELMLDYFHGIDGLHNVYEAHPHLSPAETWRSIFHTENAAESTSPYFTPSKNPGHKEMLRILREEPADTVSILVWGPLTNIAIAAAEDPETLLKVKEIVVMGGAVNVPGNVTPVSEFNCYADPVATARVYALTSLNPKSTMPPMPHKIPDGIHVLPPYPEKLSRTLKLTLCPLDITTPHEITRAQFTDKIQPFLDAGSPLATWTSHFIYGCITKCESMGKDKGLDLHDPFTVWYTLLRDDPVWKTPSKLEDIRVETAGHWTKGMHVVDRRGKAGDSGEVVTASEPSQPEPEAEELTLEGDHVDHQSWGNPRGGNRIKRIISSPGRDAFREFWMGRVYA